MAEVRPLREAASPGVEDGLLEDVDVCGLPRERTGSTEFAPGQQASPETSEVPSTRPSREASGASADNLPRADLPQPVSPPERPRLQFNRLAAAAIASLALVACILAANYSPRQAALLHRGATVERRHREEGQATAPARPSTTSALELFDSSELHQAATDNIMDVGRRVLTASDRRVVRSVVAAGLRNMSRRLREHSPKAAGVLSDMRLSDEQGHAVTKTLRLLSDHRVQSIGLEVAKAIRESESKDHWAILDRIHRRLRPIVGEIRLLRQRLLPYSLRELTRVGHHWDLTLSPANLRSMADVSDAWAVELKSLEEGAGELVAPGAEDMLSIFRKLGAVGSSSADVDEEVASATRVSAGRGEATAVARPREFSAVKAEGIAASVEEQGRYLMDVLRLSALGKDGHGHDAPVSAAALAEALHASPEEDATAVSCSGPSAAAALLCPLKFGAQGLDAMRAVVEIRILRR